MAGERQTEPHQPTYEAAMAEWDRNAAGWEKARAELARVRAERDEAREQVGWTVQRCNAAMGDGFKGTPNSAVAAVCDALKTAEARAENQAAEIVAALRMEQAQGAVPISMMADWIEREFADPARPVRDRTTVVAEIVTLIRSYANVHMTKALADLIEHKYVGKE